MWPHGRSPPGSAIHGIFQARVPEWGAISFSRGSSQPRDWTWVSWIVNRRFTVWATRESHSLNKIPPFYHSHVWLSLRIFCYRLLHGITVSIANWCISCDFACVSVCVFSLKLTCYFTFCCLVMCHPLPPKIGWKYWWTLNPQVNGFYLLNMRILITLAQGLAPESIIHMKS